MANAHRGGVNAVVLSENQKFVVSAGQLGEVCIHSASLSLDDSGSRTVELRPGKNAPGTYLCD